MAKTSTDFDPKAYLAEEPVAPTAQGEFDPSSYLQDTAPQVTSREKAVKDFNTTKGQIMADEANPQSPEIQSIRGIMRDPNTSNTERLGMLAPYLYYKGKDVGISLGVRGVPTVVGQQVGRRVAGPLGERAGGAVGAAIGDTADQFRLMAQGKQPDGFHYGELTADTLGGLIKGESMANAGIPKLGLQSLKSGAQNTALSNVQSLLDTGKFQSLENNAQSFLGGAASPLISKGAGMAFGSSIQQLNPADKLNRERLDVWSKLQKKYGIVVPPAQAERGSDILNSIAGPADSNKAASLQNQFGWQKMGREQMGLPVTVDPILPSDFKSVRSSAAAVEPYERLKEIADNAQSKLDNVKKTSLTAMGGHDLAVQEGDPNLQKLMAPLIAQAGADVDALKIQRNITQKAWTEFKNGDPSAYERWQGSLAKQDDLNGRLIAAAESAGDKDLVKRLDKSRKLIAQSYALEAATDPYTGHVNPVVLAAHGRAGVPLTENLRDMAAFASSYAKDAVAAAKVGSPGANNLSSMMSMGMFSQGTAPGFIMGVASKALGKPTRAALLSPFLQNHYSSPRTLPTSEQFQEGIARYIAMNAGRTN